jgi:hypothetical protein
MTLIQKRKKAKDLIDTADEKLLNEIIKIAESESKKIVGYGADGRDLTKGDLAQIVHEAELRYDKGEYITNEKAKNQSKQW